MLKTFKVENNMLGQHLFPNFYRFKKKIAEYSLRPDITSFNLGDKDVLDVLTDGEHAGQVFVEEGALFIKNSSVKRYYISEFDGFYITHEKNEKLPRSTIKLHDVLFTTIGKYLGVSAIANQNIVGANINQNVVIIRLNDGFTTPQYLSCFLNSKIARFQIDNLFTGNTHPILTYPKIKSIKVFIKNKKIEKEITTSIIESEKLIIESFQLIEKAKALLLNSLNVNFNDISKTLFFRASQDDMENTDMITPQYYNPLYVKTIDNIKSKNSWDLLGDVADFKTGDEVGSANYKLYLDREETDIPFIRTTDIFNYDLDRYPDFFIEKEIYEEMGQNIQNKEILYTKDGKIGLTAMVTNADKCILGSGTLRIIAKEDEVNPFYLFLVLSVEQIGGYQAKQRTVVASTLSHLRSDRISDFVIPRVSNEKEISELVEKAFELKERSKNLIDASRLKLEESLDWN